MRKFLTALRNFLGRLGPWLAGWLRRATYCTGIIGLLLIVLAFTRVPFDVHRWLGMASTPCRGGTIVVLGGSGMPSAPELLRLHRAAELALEDTGARVTVIHPGDAQVMGQMVNELVLRGVRRARIDTINQGENTREQALIFADRHPLRQAPLVLVTAPENMYRSVGAFRRAGHLSACGAAAWDHAMHHEFAYRHKAIGGKAWVPDVSDDPGLRYTFWNYLKLEITCLREFVAIAYYELNGWI